MYRITPEEVQAAYQSTGLTPTADTWGNVEENCACAMTALVYSKVGDKISFSDLLELMEDEEFHLEELLISQSYHHGFIKGFDDARTGSITTLTQSLMSTADKREYQEGFEDGKAARNLVIKGEK